MAAYIIGLKTGSPVIYTPSYEIRTTSSPSAIYWQCLGSIALFWVLSRVRGRAFALFALHNAKILLLFLNFFFSSRTGINKVSGLPTSNKPSLDTILQPWNRTCQPPNLATTFFNSRVTRVHTQFKFLNRNPTLGSDFLQNLPRRDRLR